MEEVADNRPKVYRKLWACFFTAFLCLIVVSTGVPVHAASTKKITGESRYDYAYEVLERTNQERTKRGKSALVMDKTLLQASMLRAAECAVLFDHTRPNGEDCFTICDKIYAENLACGQESPEEVVGDWVKSSGHRTNMLNGDYKSIGIGCFEYDDTLYWVQSFGREKGNDAGEGQTGTTVYQIALTKSAKTKVLSGVTAVQTDPLANKVSGVKVKAGKRKLTLTWNKKSSISGYQVQVSNKKSFNNADVYTLSKGKKKMVITKFGGSKLKGKKKYYVRIRAFVKTEVVTNESSAGVENGADDTAESDNTMDSDLPTITQKVGYTYTYSEWNTVNKKTK